MKDKLVGLKEAAAMVRDEALLGFTSEFVENCPMAFLREIVRQGKKELRVATLPGGGIHVDLLIGAGSVAEYETCHCSLGDFGPAPNFQKALRRGAIRMKDTT
ncbi:MAG TPA: hypothetical protein VLS90_09220 [Thermodesulfobacteriota bacterium]|nr:hypothetical protein [Thermodesulfobacteriota bacterium]